VEIYQAICLGIIQGITEFLPVSSSAHLMIFSQIFGLPDQRQGFDDFLNLGTILAIMVFFYPKISNIFRGAVDFVRRKKTDNRNFFVTIVLSNLPIMIVFGMVEIFLDINFSSNYLIVCSSMLFAAILLFCDKNDTSRNKITLKDGILVGFSQILSIIPGASRLGLCLSTMRFLNYSREESFAFSMILSIPPVMGACFLKIIKIFSGNFIIQNWNMVYMGSAFSFLFGILTLMVVTSFVKRHTFLPMIIYRVVFALLVLVCAGSVTA
jgi:undecaprenyl-diphosphatase